ncbi:efflux transporter outer membrane subunit [Sphingomonas lycopersici]|uniref:TolC family protein n=1 Tax=Sphingomonas lycopersici TaxID=2951807 RepID=A0AA41ZAU5_9SPHN|nr:TolC family protein [Sphingomonas lycopersici]
MNRSFRTLCPPLLVASALAGCAVAPSQPPRPTIAASPTLTDAAVTTPAATAAQWWKLFDEPALNALVEEALTSNRDLRVAAARLLQARASLSEARGARIPASNVSADAGAGSKLEDQIAAVAAGSDHIRTGSRFGLGAEVSWEVDLFGRIGATIGAARADMRATAARQDGVRVAIAAGVAESWVTACGVARQADIARRSLALARQDRDLAERLRAAGLGTPADVLQAEALAAQAEAALPPLDDARHRALTDLAVLTGHVPTEVSAAAADCRAIPRLTAPIPVGDPAALLRRRPDLRAAEQALVASAARIGIAVADLYPRISLGAMEGSSSPSVEGLGARQNFVWRAGPLLSWSFPNLSAARARIRRARAGEIAALAAFDAAILAALKEVNQAAAGYAALLDRTARLRIAADRTARAAMLVRARRKAGSATALEVLDADRSEIAAQAKLAEADTRVAVAQVVLFKTLGGGWEQAPAVTLPRPERPSSAAAAVPPAE